MKYWNETFECMPREQLRALQLDRLKKTVDKVYAQLEIGRASCRERV